MKATPSTRAHVASVLVAVLVTARSCGRSGGEANLIEVASWWERRVGSGNGIGVLVIRTGPRCTFRGPSALALVMQGEETGSSFPLDDHRPEP